MWEKNNKKAKFNVHFTYNPPITTAEQQREAKNEVRSEGSSHSYEQSERKGTPSRNQATMSLDENLR